MHKASGGDFINKKGKGRFAANPDEVDKAVQKSARSSYRLPKTVTDSVNQVLAVSLAAIKAYKEQLKIFDKAIEEQAKLIPNTLTSVKGIGPVYSAGIIAEKLVIFIVSRIKQHWLNLRVLPGQSTNQVILRLRIRD